MYCDKIYDLCCIYEIEGSMKQYKKCVVYGKEELFEKEDDNPQCNFCRRGLKSIIKNKT